MFSQKIQKTLDTQNTLQSHSNILHQQCIKCNNYEIKRWVMNRFGSVESKTKSADCVKYNSLPVL